jgi:hypothetical protein
VTDNLKTWPERIYLQSSDEPEPMIYDEAMRYEDVVTWCDVRLEKADVEYVRANLFEKLAEEVARLRAANGIARGWLQYYADRAHFILNELEAWDTVTGEPENFQCDEAGTATIEDGSMARLALMQMDGFVTDIPAPGEFHKAYAAYQAQKMV